MLAYDITLFASTLLFAIVAFAFSRHHAASVFHPVTIYLAFHGFIFVVRPIMSRIFDYDLVYTIYRFQPSIEDRITVILAASLGLLVFVSVCLRLARDPIVFVQDQFDARHREALIQPFAFACLLLVPVALYAIYETWSASASGVSSMTMDNDYGVRINTEASGYFVDLQLVLATISVMCAWLFRYRLVALMPFFLFFLLRMGTGSRGPFVFAAALLILLYLYDNRRRWPELRSAALAALVVLAFVFVVQDRGKSIRELFIEDDSVVYSGGYDVAPLEHMDFANMEYFEFVVYAVPQRTGTYDYFASNLQIFTEPIPRVWWPGKPIGPPIKFFNLFDYGRPVGITFSLPGYGWYEMGYGGVIILTALFAAFYAWIYRRMIARNHANFAVLFSMTMIATTVIAYRDGSFVSIAKMSLFYLMPIGLTFAFAKLFNIPSAAEMRRRATAMMRGENVAGNRAGAGLAGRGGGAVDGVMTPAARRAQLAGMYRKT